MAIRRWSLGPVGCCANWGALHCVASGDLDFFPDASTVERPSVCRLNFLEVAAGVEPPLRLADGHLAGPSVGR
eukprot:5988958-Lingulodinium_polyedra.AAC.1